MTTPEKIDEHIGVPGWLELYDLSLHPDMEAQIPRGAYIKGTIIARQQFSPASEILGTAITKPDGMNRSPGWIELKTLEFHRDVEAVIPVRPYVHGDMDEEARFYPDEPYEIIS